MACQNSKGENEDNRIILVDLDAMFTPYFFVSRLSQKYFVCTVGYHLQLKILITSGVLIEFKRFPMKDPCVTCYGQTQMTDVVGVFHLVVLDIPLVR